MAHGTFGVRIVGTALQQEYRICEYENKHSTQGRARFVTNEHGAYVIECVKSVQPSTISRRGAAWYPGQGAGGDSRYENDRGA